MVAFPTHANTFEFGTTDMPDRPVWDLEFDKENALRMMQEAMAEKGLTQAKLANLLGVDQPRVHRWLKGKQMPRPANRRRLAEILGLHLPGAAQKAVSEGVLIPQLDGANQEALVKAQQALLDSRNKIDEALTLIARARLSI